MKTLAELYAALAGVEKGSEMEALIKAEIARLNAECAKYRTEKNTAEAKVTELETQIKELTDKGAGSQSTVEKLQKQLDDLNAKYEAAETARKDAEARRVQADIMQQTVAALTKGNAASPTEIAKIIVGNISTKEDGSYSYSADGKEMSIEDGASGWLKSNTWAVKNTQNPGSGGAGGGGSATKTDTLAGAVAAALNVN